MKVIFAITLIFLLAAAQDVASDCFSRSSTQVGTDRDTIVSNLEMITTSFTSEMKLYKIRGCVNSNKVRGVQFILKTPGNDDSQLELGMLGPESGTCTDYTLEDNDHVKILEVTNGIRSESIESFSIVLNSGSYYEWGKESGVVTTKTW